MISFKAVLGVALLGAAVLPSSSLAASAGGAGGTLTYTAAPGELNYVSIGTGPSAAIRLGDSGAASITPSGTCTTYTTGEYGNPSVECTGITRVVVRMGDMNDGTSYNAVPVPVELYGEAGNDKLVDGWSNDVLDGGDGDDEIDVSGTYAEHLGSMNGADVIRGGSGMDWVHYVRTDYSAVNLSRDGIANDGAPGEGDNVGVDVEGLKGGYGDDVLSGSNGPDAIDGGQGNDTINGLGGDDVLEGLGGRDTIDGGQGRDSISGSAEADTILARDGEADTISCGSDADHAAVDDSDILAGNALDLCESVDRSGGGAGIGSGGSTNTSDGDSAAATFAVSRGRTTRSGTAQFTLDIAGPGTLNLRAVTKQARGARAARSVVVGKARRTINAAGRYSVTFRPNRAGRRLLRRHRKLRVTISMRFVPRSGSAQTVRRTVTLRRK
jgi:hypothetical protein